MPSRALAAAYRSTLYRAEPPEGEIDLRVGARSPALERALGARGAVRWGWLTAENPGSRRLGAPENRARTARLAAELALLGWRWIPGVAIDPRGEWPAEASFLVLDPEPARLAELARSWEQNAYLEGAVGARARLRFARAPRRGAGR